MEIEKQYLRLWGELYMKPVLDVTLINACNLRCKMCAFWRRYSLDGDSMSIEKYIQLLDQVLETKVFGQKIKSIRLDGSREPLLYKNLARAVKETSDRGLKPFFLTNGVFLTKDLSVALLEANLSEISFSVTGYTADVYAEYQGYNKKAGQQLQVVKENIQRFIELRNKMKKNTIIDITYIVSDDSAHEARQSLQFWKDIGIDKIVFNNLGNPFRIEREDWNELPLRSSPECMRLISVLPNGDVIPCCHRNERHILGNCFTEHLNNILNGKIVTEFLQHLATGQLEKIPSESECHSCVYIRKLPEANGFRARM